MTIDVRYSKCRLRNQQVKTKRRKNPHPHSNGYYVQCDKCIFYGTESCLDFKGKELVNETEIL